MSTVLAIVLLLGSNASPEKRWQDVFQDRMRTIEVQHGIMFDRGWVPTVAFGYPEGLSPLLRFSFGASYDPLTRSFIVAPALENAVIEPSLIDHELGHALADQVSRRIGNGIWPDPKDWESLSVHDHISVNIISEGIGSYFGGPSNNASEEWLPEGQADLTWTVHDFIYHGGHWLVAPIIRQFGEQGIAYLVTHQFAFSGGNVRTPAKEYQRKALEELSLLEASAGSQ